MKICIIGNSHVGALKRAWDAESYPSIEIVFFAARGARLRDLTVKRKVLVPATRSLKNALKFTSGGISRIDPKQYDYFLIYGAQAVHLLLCKDSSYSQAVLRDTAKDHVQNTVSFELIKKLRKITDKKIFIGHHPLYAAESLQHRDISAEYLDGIDQLNRVAYSELNCEMIAQPPETIVNGYFTDPIYTKGSKRLTVNPAREGKLHPENDKTHMNEKFGKMWLESLFARIVKDDNREP